MQWILVIARVCSDAPRLTDVLPLSVMIYSNQPSRSDDTFLQSAAEPDDHLSLEDSKRVLSEQRKRRQLSLDGCLLEKSESSMEKMSKITESAEKSGKELASVGVEQDTSNLSADDSSSLVAIQKRLSRAETVKQQQCDDDHDDAKADKDVDDDGGCKTSQPTTETSEWKNVEEQKG